MMVAICFGIFSNLMWGIPSMVVDLAPFIAQGYFERPRFYKINLCVVTANVIIILPWACCGGSCWDTIKRQ
jgi:DASS family divalent anion:Na+ symporter